MRDIQELQATVRPTSCPQDTRPPPPWSQGSSFQLRCPPMVAPLTVPKGAADVPA